MSRATSPRVEMLPAQRRALILETVRAHGAASIQMLSDRLSASASTVRRDLEYLTDGGYLDRTHGGAVVRRAPGARFEPEAAIAAETARPQKGAIAALAARRVISGQTVLFDAGSTVRAAARAIAEGGVALTAVTNDLRCAALLMTNDSMRVIVTGGTVRPGASTLVGEPGFSFLDDLHVDVAFIGVHTISPPVFTETSLEVAAMKRRMIAAAGRSIVLADAGKFTGPSFCAICRIDEVDEIITDDAADEAQRAALGVDAGRVAVASVEGDGGWSP